MPYLGRIPIIGELFKTRSRKREKRNLMVFIRPKILRDGLAAAIATDAKYNYIRNEQLKAASTQNRGPAADSVHARTRCFPPIPAPLPPRDSAPQGRRTGRRPPGPLGGPPSGQAPNTPSPENATPPNQ